MVNTFIFSLAVIACLVPSISGDNCKPDLSYCGSTLLQTGNYSDQVDAALKAQSLNTSAQVTANTLFDCIGGPNGDIKVISYCYYGCTTVGVGNSDYCKNTGQAANSTSSATILPSPLSTTTVVIYPSASPTTPTKSSNDSNGSHAAPIVGGVIGGVVALALIGTMVFLFFRNKRHRQERSDKVLVPSVGDRPIGQQKPLYVSRPPNSRDFGSTAYPIEDERPVYEVPGFSEPRIHEAPTDPGKSSIRQCANAHVGDW